MDYIIFMLRKLDELSSWYNAETTDPVTKFNTSAGFIRNMYLEYVNTGDPNIAEWINEWINSKIYKYEPKYEIDLWALTAGNFDFNFVTYAGKKENYETSLVEFFASFLPPIDYNDNSGPYYNQNYTTFYDTLMTNPLDSYILSKRYQLPDPLNSGYTIEFFHLIAAIDAIYENTGRNDLVCDMALSDNYSKDVCSWLGDLHTFANDIQKKAEVSASTYLPNLPNYNLSLGHIDFNDFTHSSDNFSAEDLIADVDAMNIVKLFLDGTDNSLADAILGYYTVIKKDDSLSGNRYFNFISTATMDLNGGAGYTNLKDKFINEVSHPMNIEYSNNAYIDKKYYNTGDSAMHLLKLKEEDNGTEYLPDFAVRKYCTQLFCDYIIMNSHKFD